LWTSLTFLAIYRLFVATFVATIAAIGAPTFSLGEFAPRLFVVTSQLYLAAAIAFFVVLRRMRERPQGQLTVHILTDILVTTLLMSASGGFRSGLGVMLLISLAGAALVADRKTTLFYAACATIAILAEQTWWVLRQDGQTTSYLQPGLLSLGYFATAIIVNRLAERVLLSERLARERGVQLANQLRVNELVIQDVADGVLVVDATGLVRQHNRQAAQLLGQSDLDGRALAELAPAFTQQLAEWRAGRAGEREPIRIAATERRVRARFQGAGVAGASLTLVFIEDLSRLEEEAQRVKLVALGRLTANIAHEIRNPLSAITHASDLMAEENRAHGRERLGRIIRDNAYRLDRMVRDVLELNRRDRAQIEPIALAAFVDTFVEEFTQYGKLAPEAFVIEIAADVVAAFDRVHLHQILWNLVGNAWRHSSQSAASVRVRAESVGGRLELHVIDDGPGVAPEARAQLFEPFFTTFSKGTGLGLYIARELAAANGAVLEYVAPAAGTTAGGADFRLRWLA
jgi:two-component system, NtrC family, sensor histidine kinase PilS